MPKLGRSGLVALFVLVVVATAAITALLVNIFQRQAEESTPFVRLVDVGEDDVDPAKWGTNWPLQYDGYQRTATLTSTRFGGHGGSASVSRYLIIERRRKCLFRHNCFALHEGLKLLPSRRLAFPLSFQESKALRRQQ